MQASVQLVDDRSRKCLTVGERERFIAPDAHEPKPADRTFVLMLAHTGARVSEVLALRAMDGDSDAGAVRSDGFRSRLARF